MIGALGSLLIGSIGSLTQNKLKRLFAYTSLVQMGFVVLCFIGGTVEALQGAYFFFLVYTISMLGVFIIMLNTESFITGRSLLYVTDLKDFSKYNFWIGVLFSIMMFSQAGIPPLAGFFSKFIVFKYLVISGYYYLAIYCIIISAIASFAYIRVVKAMFSDKSKRQKYIYDCFLFFNNSHILNRGYTKNHGDNFWVSIFIKAVIFLVSAVLILIPIVLDSSLALTGKLAEDTICVVSK
jgi:NADH:ubiquinone oxidoreductase subunit 2 (subunit N)